jgi:hypothetical protein
MLMISAQRGLCSACKGEPTCIYPRDSGRPILNCEEFELCFMPPPETTGIASAPADCLDSGFPAQEEHSSSYPGLCANCENRETCIYPKPEGGIWHCDEYC